jgi:hypothetical protein
VSILPQFTVWDQRYAAFNPLVPDGEPEPLGADLTTDTLGARQIPSLGPVQTAFQQIPGATGYVMSFGKSSLAMAAQRRTLPIAFDVGISDRLAVGVTVPLVQTELRASFALDTTDATVGWNPTLAGTAGADSIYTKFFTELDSTLARMQALVSAGTQTCTAFQAAVAMNRANLLRSVLRGAVLGDGAPQSPVMPLTASTGGVVLDTTVDAIQRDFNACGAPGFSEAILLPSARIDATGFQTTLLDPAFGFSALPLGGVRRWALGDIELRTKFRYLDGTRLRGSASAVVRLPTGGLDRAENYLDLSPADRQMDFEVNFINEWAPTGGIVLHGAVRAGWQLPQTLARRVTPPWAPLAAAGFETEVRRDPGDYLDVFFAPMIELAPGFTAGLGGRYRRRDIDRHTYASPADSTLVFQRTGVAVSASVLDIETWERDYRVAFGMAYTTPGVQASFSYEMSFFGGGGGTPFARRFMLGFRTTRGLF